MTDSTIDQIISECAKLRMQRRTEAKMRIVAAELAKGRTIERAAKLAGVSESAVKGWRGRYPPFDDYATGQVAANREGRLAATAARRRSRSPVLSESTDDVPGLGLEDFRMAYFGRPTPIHQQAWVKALEDPTNLYVFIFAPPGSGKDTLAGDYVGWEVGPDTTGQRVAWFMESQDFSRRRLGRLAKYLTDPKVYDHKPAKTPDGAKPTRSLIDDFGPFKWEQGMVHPDGTKVERPTWTRDTMYFVRVQAPEQDPNLWATGIGGATYGSRIDVCVCSDIFTVENQASPTERSKQLEWVKGTLDTRLDESGRLIIIGTMLPTENNYEKLLEAYTHAARAVHTETVGPSVYTKYSNGVAVVVTKAITTDPNTGEEASYWPERFPLDSEYHYKGKRFRVADLTDARILELADKGATRLRGLKDRQAIDGRMFKAMYQQERDFEVGGDFTEETLISARQPARTFGVAYPRERIIVGVDPARTYGAAWVALAVDQKEKTVTLVDYFFGDQLGTTGIKDRLIIEPLNKWNPKWLCYEINRESAILDDTLISEAIRASGVSVYKHYTGRNRSSAVSGVGTIAHFMRSGQFQIPYQTAADRVRFEVLADHVKAWDADVTRSKPGRSGHTPDDLAMAAWFAWLKARPMIESDQPQAHGMRTYVPPGVLAKEERRRQQRQGPDRVTRRRRVSAEDVMKAWLEDDSGS